MSTKAGYEFLFDSREETNEEREGCKGFTIERRRILWLPLMAASALCFAAPRSLSANSSTNAEQAAGLEWDEFIARSNPTAEELHRNSSGQGQDAYLYWLASMAARLRLDKIPRAKLTGFGALNPPVEFGLSHRGAPFFIIEWRLAPGAYLPPHCHPNASVCTLGVEGTARVRNFEFVAARPDFSSKQTFEVRETRSEIISPGRINTLASTRDNIHTFRAGREGARGIDISTYHGKDVGFSFLKIGDKPKNPDQQIFEAAWEKI